MLNENKDSVLMVVGFLAFVILAVYILSQDVSLIGPF